MTKRTKRAFSLVELLLIIVIVAIVSGIMLWRLYGISATAQRVADEQNVVLWNQAYHNVIASDYITPGGTSFAQLGWTDASRGLAAGISISKDENGVILVPVPEFHTLDPQSAFVIGKGIVINP